MTAAGVTRETLEEAPGRVLDFLFGVGKSPIARAMLAGRGYDAAEHKRGWRLLEATGNRTAQLAFTDDEIAAAEAELDQWDEGGIRLIHAGLTRHPAQRQFVLNGITPATGPAAVLNVSTLMGRLDSLEADAEGRAALETLAKRGLPKAERTRLTELVSTAKAGTPSGLSAEQIAAEDASFEAALVELRTWYDEWSEIARLVIKRRDLLIRLGLAERRSPGSGGGVGGGGGGGGGGGDPSPFITEPVTK